MKHIHYCRQFHQRFMRPFFVQNFGAKNVLLCKKKRP